MIRPLVFALFIWLISVRAILAQGQEFNDRINWKSLFEISDMPAGPSREAKIAGFLFNRVPNNPYEWRRDMAQMIDNRLYEWTESIVLIKDKHNVIRFVTTFSVEFRRMVDLLTQPESSLPGEKE